MLKKFLGQKIRRSRLSIRMIWLVLIVSVVLLGSTLFISVRLTEGTMYENFETRGSVLGPLATFMLSAPMFLEDETEIQETIRTLMKSDPAIATVKVADNKGAEWLETEPWSTMEEQLRSPGGRRDQVLVHRDRRGVHVLGRVRYDGEIIGRVGLVLSLEMVQAHKKRMTLWMGALALGILSFAMVGILIYLRRTVEIPLQEVTKAAHTVAEGDLSKAITVRSDDEIGELAQSFSIMTANLSSLLTKAKEAVSQLTSASDEVSSASKQQASATREQSATISETTSAATELAKSNEQVGENIRKVMEVTDHSMAGMVAIKKSISGVADQVVKLSEKSQKIGKITELIEDVADQTNLLAVNAAIEAARAGEHGRGFTVVADEIRKLSDSTAKSTKDITALIEEIQHEVKNATLKMEQSMGSVDEEVVLSRESADRAKEIAMSVTQQINGSKQIAEAMRDIDETMKQISMGAQQSQEVAVLLTRLGDELRDVTERFKVNGNGANGKGEQLWQNDY